MTITDGSVILDSDLNTLAASGLSYLIADRLKAPKGFLLPLQFANVLAATPAAKRTKSVVMPRDCYLESMIVHCGDVNATVTVNLTGNGSLYNWPVSATETVPAGRVNFIRTWFNNATTKVQDRGFRLINQGSNVTVVVESTKASGSSVITVELALRQFLGR